MFTTLDELKYRINKDITDIESVWTSKDPDNELYYAEICGLKRALDHVSRIKQQRLNELDAWAEREFNRKDKNANNTRETN
jgi:hypothetical protein